MKKLIMLFLLAGIQLSLLSCNDNNAATATNHNDTVIVPDNRSAESSEQTPVNNEGEINSGTTQSPQSGDHDIGLSDNSQSTENNECVPNPNRKELRTPLILQEQDLWCWAASGQMVMTAFKMSISQCNQANTYFNREDCCLNPDRCDATGLPPFNQFGLETDSTECGALSWQDLKTEIGCRKKPFCVSWRDTDDPTLTDTAGHMMVVSGYKRQDGEDWVKVLDPADVRVTEPAWILYSEYVRGSGYEHWDDYYNIRRKVSGDR